MSAWVQFKNLTKYNAILIKVEDMEKKILLIHNVASKYFYVPSGNIIINIYTANNKKIDSLLIPIIPARLQTIILN